MGAVCPAWLKYKIHGFQKHLRSLQGSRGGFFREFAQGIINDRRIPDPFSLEIHPHLPGQPRCTNMCRTCTGQSYAGGEYFQQGISEELMARIIHAATHDEQGRKKRRVPAISFAGNCVEPLLYPNLHVHIGKAMAAASFVGILTNMIMGDEATFQTFTNPSSRAFRYFRASVNAANPDDYDAFHRPDKVLIGKILSERGMPLEHGETIFGRVLRNMERLAKLRRQRRLRTSMALELNYLLYPGNDNEPDIAALIKWANKVGLTAVNFRTPQIPQMCTAPFVPLEPARVRELRKFLGSLLSNTGLRREVPLTDPLEETRAKPFSNCWTRFIYAVVGFDGGLYPCTSVAAPRCSEFGEGNLNKNPDFWKLWQNPGRIDAFWEFMPGRCDEPMPGQSNPTHVCTRTELAFNLLMDRYWEPTADKISALCRLYRAK